MTLGVGGEGSILMKTRTHKAGNEVFGERQIVIVKMNVEITQ